MPESRPESPVNAGRNKRWATVNLVVALMLLAAVAVLRLRATLADGTGLLLLSAIGILALISAAFLFRSLLRR